MSRTLVIGDIHGGYKALLQVMEQAKVTTSDQLIFLGDYVDGWSESHEVVRLLMKLQYTHNCVFLKGNHESLLMDWLITKKENKVWEFNGGDSSIKSYNSLSEQEVKEHLDFFDALQLYYKDDNNRLFVHAGFTNPRGIEAEFFQEYMYWDRTLWEMVMAMNPDLQPDSPFYPKRLLHYKEIFIGHTPVTNFGLSIPTNYANVWNIDTGAAFMGRISIMDIDTKEYWQSDVVANFYPHEEGRNHKK
ncbi:MAG: serine/threonine protein phosphatase [Flavobacteriaceae bacterium]|jgi:serine/threonine protein phosphatase 1|nr:serine/threonine protein phosphatase [Flavobacteriaceae bacterium]